MAEGIGIIIGLLIFLALIGFIFGPHNIIALPVITPNPPVPSDEDKQNTGAQQDALTEPLQTISNQDQEWSRVVRDTNTKISQVYDILYQAAANYQFDEIKRNCIELRKIADNSLRTSNSYQVSSKYNFTKNSYETAMHEFSDGCDKVLDGMNAENIDEMYEGKSQIMNGKNHLNDAVNSLLPDLKSGMNTNEYWNHSLASCTPGSISARCSSPDSCVDCNGNCHDSGTNINDLICIQGKWASTTAPTEEWERTFGGVGDERASSVQQTNDGGYILASWTDSFGAGKEDAWLIKTDSLGNKVWDNTFGGKGDDKIYAVCQTNDGGYILAGETSSFGGGGKDVWLIKTDSLGKRLWDNTFGDYKYDSSYADSSYAALASNSLVPAPASLSSDIGNDRYDHAYAASVRQTNDDGYIMAVTATWPPSSGAYVNAWLIKTNSIGNKLWQKTFGRLGDDKAFSVQQTNDGGYIIAGKTFIGMDNGWLIKTDSRGNMVWEKTFGGNIDCLNSVLQTRDGGYIAVGDNGWFIETDSQGNLLREKTFGGNSDCLNSIQQTNDFGYIIAGETGSFGAGYNAWLIKTDSLGNKLWQKTFGGTSYNDYSGASSVQQTNDGGYILAGWTHSSSARGDDAWLIKIGASDKNAS